MEYEFEKIKDPRIKAEEMAHTTPLLFSLLAKLITDNDKNKEERLFRMLDKSLEWNEQLPVKEQIALVGQVTKKALTGK
ncbi:hypothetical protein I5F94_03275 [Proteus mirabilis]|uniref:hypothetical protein n=1 Tax=Proteus mirabilis TaxID=584 RepID=UPI0002833DD7|nr:hypothetical protein [Proteus mirabilis]EKB01397.1 hypothetical protein HMPREF1311_00928 [Proteus mirabilis WGLW6]MBG2969313.1 hypothetical protein [Proteus mirabilis]MBG6040475.1 hypothetical protein [Proteus mirabilis]MCU9563810.1 hypothetical protein [Proteus mirabilis]MDC5877593.1 hypothetical protein [Proteus mirabilis]